MVHDVTLSIELLFTIFQTNVLIKEKVHVSTFEGLFLIMYSNVIITLKPAILRIVPKICSKVTVRKSTIMINNSFQSKLSKRKNRLSRRECSNPFFSWVSKTSSQTTGSKFSNALSDSENLNNWNFYNVASTRWKSLFLGEYRIFITGQTKTNNWRDFQKLP